MNKIKIKFLERIISIIVLVVIIINILPIHNSIAVETNKYGEPIDVINATSWDQLEPSRYSKSYAEAKESSTGTKDKNYKIAVENELTKLNTLLTKVTDSELKEYDSEKINKYLDALKNFTKNEAISKLNGTLISDTFFVDAEDIIKKLENTHGDDLTSEQNDKVANIENNVSDNMNENYSEHVANNDQEVEEDGADGGMLLKPIFAFVNFIADAILAGTQTIMLSDTSPSRFETLVNSITGPFVLMKSGNGSGGTLTSEDAIFDKMKQGSTFTIDNLGHTMTAIQFPHIHYSPEEIFSNQIGILNIDFISGEAGGQSSGLGAVRRVVAAWYKVLRMIAIIGLLSVLIYTGIKIIISSNARDKAKYKEWILNWFVAVAILFSLHYIMSFTITVVNQISDMLYDASSCIHVTGANKGLMGGLTETTFDFNTNLIGLARFMTQSDNFRVKVGYEMIYIALIIYTVKFTFVYLKRVLNMAFLTLMAPIVALTYPIDKISDGQAQGFNMWIKEYIFNALLQPLHFIMYYILVSSAIGIAASNPIYAIVALIFMKEAERLLKKVFGFDKAQGGTVGGMANAFAAGAIASNIKNIAKFGNKAFGGKNGSGDKPVELPLQTKNDINPNNFMDIDENGNFNLGTGSSNSENNDIQQNTVETSNNEQINSTSNSNLSTNNNSNANSNNSSGGNPQQNSGINYDNQNNINENTHSTENSGESRNLPTSNGVNTRQSIREMAKKAKRNRLVSGMGAVGSRLIRPVYDTRRSAKSNARTWTRRLAKAPAAIPGLALGVTAAAVQAGISIADGNYNPIEAIASFAAGASLGGRAANSLGNTFMEGWDSADNSEEAKQRRIERIARDRVERDDVLAYIKAKHPDNYKQMQERYVSYFERGQTDLKQISKDIKFADYLARNNSQKMFNKDYNDLSKQEKAQLNQMCDIQSMKETILRKSYKERGLLKAANGVERDKILAMAKTEKERKDMENGFRLMDQKHNLLTGKSGF